MEKGNPLNNIFEDWDGERVLSATKHYKATNEFLKVAQEYVKATRDKFYPISESNIQIRDILLLGNKWIYADKGEENNIEGEKIEVYEIEILYDFEFYTFSEREQNQIDDVLKEIDLWSKDHGGKLSFDEWTIPIIMYIEDLDDYQRAEVRKVFTRKKERGEWS